MESYGSELKYDISTLPIELAVTYRLFEAVKNKFIVDYGLKPQGEGMVPHYRDGFVMTFNKNVDAFTFLRHLRTLTPEQYEALA